MIRRSLELILAVAVPAALMMALGAEVWIAVVFGHAFAPAALALRVLSAVFLVMYVSIVCWCALTMLNRAWTLTAIFALGLVVNPVLNLSLIKPGLLALGGGGGGAACATATLGTEIAVVTPMLVFMGRRTIDARLIRMVTKTLVSAALVIGLDVLLLRPTLGPERLVLDALVYVALVLGSGALNVGEMRVFVKTALNRPKTTSV
jgi:O-antigen/teichoic acid export membrane protein